MEVDEQEKDSIHQRIERLESIEDDVSKLLKTVKQTMVLLQKLDPEKENEIEQSIDNYHLLLQRIELSLTKQINECREPLLLPLLPIGHKDQYISADARPIHKQLFSPNRKNKTHQINKTKPLKK